MGERDGAEDAIVTGDLGGGVEGGAERGQLGLAAGNEFGLAGGAGSGQEEEAAGLGGGEEAGPFGGGAIGREQERGALLMGAGEQGDEERLGIGELQGNDAGGGQGGRLVKGLIPPLNPGETRLSADGGDSAGASLCVAGEGLKQHVRSVGRLPIDLRLDGEGEGGERLKMGGCECAIVEHDVEFAFDAEDEFEQRDGIEREALVDERDVWLDRVRIDGGSDDGEKDGLEALFDGVRHGLPFSFPARSGGRRYCPGGRECTDQCGRRIRW